MIPRLGQVMDRANRDGRGHYPGYHVMHSRKLWVCYTIGLCAAAIWVDLAISAATGQTSHEVVNTAKVYQFDSVSGSDSNDCVSSPCRTISKANSLIYRSGDAILFKAGVTWNNTTANLRLCGPNAACVQNVYPGTADRPLIVSTYGGGTCNVVAQAKAGCATFALDPSSELTHGIELHNVSNVTVKNFVVLGGTTKVLSVLGGTGVLVQNHNGPVSSISGINIENNEIKDFAIGVGIQQKAGHGATITSCSVQDNVVAGSEETTTVDMGILIEYAGNQCNPRGNLITNVGGHIESAPGYYKGCCGNGILISDGAGPIVDEFNVTSRIGANNVACGGPAANWAYNSVNVTFQFNESFLTRPSHYTTGCDWVNFDLDGGTRNSVVQYNYSHQAFGAGYLMYAANVGANKWGPNTVRYNISENDGTGGIDGSLAFGVGYAANLSAVVYIYNNTFWGNSANETVKAFPISFSNCPSLGSVVANNIFAATKNAQNRAYFVSMSRLTCPGLTWKANDYYPINGGAPYWLNVGTNGESPTTLAGWQAIVPGGDAGAAVADPQLAGAGSGQSCGPAAGRQSCPEGFRLRHGSPVVGAGFDLTQPPYSLVVGTRDFYGQKVPHAVGSGYNIGADGGNP
jgi:hypothetical protein